MIAVKLFRCIILVPEVQYEAKKYGFHRLTRDLYSVKCGLVGRRQFIPKVMQSARISLQSSEFGPPRPLNRKRMLSLPLWFRGGGALAGEGAGGAPIRTKGQTLWYFTVSTVYSSPSTVDTVC